MHAADVDLLTKAQKAIAWLREHGCQPNYNGGYRPNDGNGQSQKGNEAAIPMSENPDPAWCPVHNITMKQRGKDGQIWYSHKASDGSWCKGKNGK